jgi:thiol-disulfide isomerase/thioredoxin
MKKYLIGLLFFALAGFFYKVFTPKLSFAPVQPIHAYSIIEDKVVNSLDEKEFPSIVVFWNSECRPCKAEMIRLQNAISEGKIPGGRVKAINIGDSLELVQSFAMEHEYQFQFFANPDEKSLEVYKVPGTPTVYHFNKKGQVVWSAMGLVPESIDQAEKLFL